MHYNSGGGFWGVSAAASAGFSTKDETNSVTAECQEEKMMNIAYKVHSDGKRLIGINF